ncbi:hypothetical protein F5Y03DRAFT_401013 [Xylaria venustula]|nr:hypothetical protein F5Y03DRAFT_401013 [Xylaria venustula]
MASSGKLVVIEPKSDAVIFVFKATEDPEEVKEARFQVSRLVVEKLELSGDKYEIHLASDEAASTTTVELFLHCIVAETNTEHEVPIDFYALPIIEVCRVLTLVDIEALQYSRSGRYNVTCNCLRTWFAAWFTRRSPDFTEEYHYSQLLFPAFVLRDSQMFATVTKWLAYNVARQVRERNPQIIDDDDRLNHDALQLYKDMHMPKRIIRLIRWAKAGLRDMLIGLLDKCENPFLRSKCLCRIQGLANFNKTLLMLGEPEFDSTYSMLEYESAGWILDSIIEVFDYEAPKGLNKCSTCDSTRQHTSVKDWILHEAKGIASEFKGLCMVCLNSSINKRSDYETWTTFEACARHGEMSWKHSDLSPSP